MERKDCLLGLESSALRQILSQLSGIIQSSDPGPIHFRSSLILRLFLQEKSFHCISLCISLLQHSLHLQ
jgi:hypothetical protein